MNQRQQLLILFKILRRRMDAERTAFNKALLKAHRSVIKGDEPMDAFVLERMRAARQPVLDEWYGRFAGDESGRFFKLVQQQGQLAFRMAAERERAMVLEAVDGFPSLVDLVTRDSA